MLSDRGKSQTRALLLGLPPTGQERQELVNPCSVRKEDEERGKGSGQNWLFYNVQKRLFRCLAVGMKLNNLILAY